MPVFKFASQVTVSAYTTVAAADLETALEIAETRDVEMGGPNSGVDEDEVWVIDDADGLPDNIHISEQETD